MLIIIIYLVAIVVAFAMVTYRAWEIRTLRVERAENVASHVHHFSFRNIEKVMLYLAKSIVVGTVTGVAKYWFIATTKTKKWLEESWPKVHKIFESKPRTEEDGLTKPRTFIRRTILESRSRIRRIKEKVKQDHE